MNTFTFIAMIVMMALGCVNSSGNHGQSTIAAGPDEVVVHWLCYGATNIQNGEKIDAHYDEKLGHCVCLDPNYEPVTPASTVSASPNEAFVYYIRSYCMPRAHRNLQQMTMSRIMAMEMSVMNAERSQPRVAGRNCRFRKELRRHVSGPGVISDSDAYKLTDYLPGCYDPNTAHRWTVEPDELYPVTAKRLLTTINDPEMEILWACYGAFNAETEERITARFDAQTGQCTCSDEHSAPIVPRSTVTAPVRNRETQHKFDAYLSPYDQQYADVPEDQLLVMQEQVSAELTDRLYSSPDAYIIQAYCAHRTDVNQFAAVRMKIRSQERAVSGFGNIHPAWEAARSRMERQLRDCASIQTCARNSELAEPKQPAGCDDWRERNAWALPAPDDPLLEAAKNFLPDFR